MLSKEEVEKSIATDLGREWELKDGKLVKSFQFSSFMDAIDFVNEIAKIAETLEHRDPREAQGSRTLRGQAQAQSSS